MERKVELTLADRGRCSPGRDQGRLSLFPGNAKNKRWDQKCSDDCLTSSDHLLGFRADGRKTKPNRGGVLGEKE